MEDLKFVGKSFPRIDAKEKITGAAQYVDDLEFGPNLLYAEIVESSEAFARIVKVDTSEAEKVPGVIKIITGKDFPYKFGLYLKDRYILAQDMVRFKGEQIAGVIARDPKIARRAAKLVRVEYDPIPPILNQMDSIKEDSIRIHPQLGEYPHGPAVYPVAGTNIAHWKKVRLGEWEKGIA
jgi:carbon-monoxide dehydrogenase large subunit